MCTDEVLAPKETCLDNVRFLLRAERNDVRQALLASYVLNGSHHELGELASSRRTTARLAKIEGDFNDSKMRPKRVLNACKPDWPSHQG